MKHLTDHLNELLESIDSGILSDEELKRMFDNLGESEAKRIARQGVELLRMLESIDPDSVMNNGDQVPSRASES